MFRFFIINCWKNFCRLLLILENSLKNITPFFLFSAEQSRTLRCFRNEPFSLLYRRHLLIILEFSSCTYENFIKIWLNNLFLIKQKIKSYAWLSGLLSWFLHFSSLSNSILISLTLIFGGIFFTITLTSVMKNIQISMLKGN